jgi:hypothetical protein
MVKENSAQRFMRATGKLRAIFGPANRSSLVHEMTEQNKELLEQRQAETQQWETLRPPGTAPEPPRTARPGRGLRPRWPGRFGVCRRKIRAQAPGRSSLFHP